jgi:hypothetical protein
MESLRCIEEKVVPGFVAGNGKYAADPGQSGNQMLPFSCLKLQSGT